MSYTPSRFGYEPDVSEFSQHMTTFVIGPHAFTF